MAPMRLMTSALQGRRHSESRAAAFRFGCGCLAAGDEVGAGAHGCPGPVVVAALSLPPVGAQAQGWQQSLSCQNSLCCLTAQLQPGPLPPGDYEDLRLTRFCLNEPGLVCVAYKGVRCGRRLPGGGPGAGGAGRGAGAQGEDVALGPGEAPQLPSESQVVRGK